MVRYYITLLPYPMSRNLCIGDPPKNPFGIHQLPCLPSISCGGSWYALVTENIVMKTSRRELPPEVLNVGILVNDVFDLDMISLSGQLIWRVSRSDSSAMTYPFGA